MRETHDTNTTRPFTKCIQNNNAFEKHNIFSILLPPALYFGAHCRKFEEKPRCIHEKQSAENDAL